MKKSSRVLSFLLAIVLVLALVPTTVISFAASTLYSILLQPTLNGELSGVSEGDTAVVTQKDTGAWTQSLVRYTGNSVKKITDDYGYIGNFSADGYAAVYNQDFQYGVVDVNGNQVVACIYDDIYVASDGAFALATVRDGENYSYNQINLKSGTRSPFSIGSDGWIHGYGGGYALVSNMGDFKYVNSEGENAFGKKYQSANVFSRGYAVVKSVGQDVYQIINTKGSALASVQYDYYGIVGDNERLGVESDGKWGYINLSGQLVIPLQYVNAGVFHNGYAVVQKDGYPYYDTALIDTNGNEVIPFGKYKTLTNVSSTGLVWATDKNDRVDVIKVDILSRPAGSYSLM